MVSRRLLIFLQSFNSLERDEAGWHSLLKQADERLELRHVQRIPGNILAVLEVGFKSTQYE